MSDIYDRRILATTCIKKPKFNHKLFQTKGQYSGMVMGEVVGYQTGVEQVLGFGLTRCVPGGRCVVQTSQIGFRVFAHDFPFESCLANLRAFPSLGFLSPLCIVFSEVW